MYLRVRVQVKLRLLDIDELKVLERLQEAVDLGVPIEDDGDGGFRLPRAIGDRLEAGRFTMPFGSQRCGKQKSGGGCEECFFHRPDR